MSDNPNSNIPLTDLRLAQLDTHGDAIGAQHSARERELPELQPVDRGRAAWQILMAAFIFEALFWGQRVAQSFRLNHTEHLWRDRFSNLVRYFPSTLLFAARIELLQSQHTCHRNDGVGPALPRIASGHRSSSIPKALYLLWTGTFYSWLAECVLCQFSARTHHSATCNVWGRNRAFVLCRTQYGK